jgi:hypothetical protein
VTGKDVLVEAIFEAVSRIEASPEGRRLAVVRAGVIAQAYQGDALTEEVFGSCADQVLHDDNDLNLRSLASAETSTH